MKRIIFLPILLVVLWSSFYSYSKAITEQEYIYNTINERADDIELLARVIQAECGASWCSDELQYLTGAVIINRVDDPRFPDNLHDVVYQGAGTAGVQYSTWIWFDSITPSTRARLCAVNLILWGCENTPPDLVYQANFKQGYAVYAELQGVYLCQG